MLLSLDAIRCLSITGFNFNSDGGGISIVRVKFLTKEQITVSQPTYMLTGEDFDCWSRLEVFRAKIQALFWIMDRKAILHFAQDDFEQ